MDSVLTAAGLPLAYGSEMYIVQIAYKDINLMDLKAAGPPPAYGSEIYIM